MNVTYVQIEIQEGVEGKKVRKKGKIDRWGELPSRDDCKNEQLH